MSKLGIKALLINSSLGIRNSTLSVYIIKIKEFLVKLASTFFFIGYLPLIPGTYGSLAAVILLYIFRFDTLNLIFLIAAFTLLGFLVAGRTERLLGRKDARCIVIDEVCGMLIALVGVPFKFKYVAAAFILFRLMDTLKPYPARMLEKQKGSVGIMSDDLIAGVYANLVFQVFLRLAIFKAS